MFLNHIVFLTEEGIKKFDSQKFNEIRKGMNAFICTKIEPNGNYFYMEISFPKNTKKSFQLSIPHKYIDFFMSGEDVKKYIGFQTIVEPD